jgi:hypothetical protein
MNNTVTYEHLDITFTVKESRFGLFTSVKDDGTNMITALTEDACVRATKDVHIPVLLGCFEGYTSEPRSSTVYGKL